MGSASDWESQIPRRSRSPCKYPSPLTNYSWTASVLTVLITSGWHVPVARAPHPGPTGFPWRHLREVRRGWWGRRCPLPPGPCSHQCHPQNLLSPIYPCGLHLLPVQSPLLSTALASLPDLFPMLPLLEGLHELPMRMLFAPCLHFLGSGRSQEEVGVPVSPLPCLQCLWAPLGTLPPYGMGAKPSCVGRSQWHPCRALC